MSPESNEQKFVPEAALVELLPAFNDYTYDRHEPRYPYDIPGDHSDCAFCICILPVSDINL